MSHNPPYGSGYPGYPPQQPGAQGYPPQSGYPPQGAQGAQGGYPPQSGYPPQQGGYPPQTGYPPQSGYPSSPAQPGSTPGAYPQSGYPPQQPGQPGATGAPGAAGAYPGASGYPPQTPYSPSQPGYNPAQPGYNPQQGYPPSSYSHASGYPPATGGYPGSPSPYGAPPAHAPQQPGAPQAWYGQFYNQINPQEMQVLQAWFSSVDKDRSGEISAPELAQLNFNNRLLGQEPARKLIAIFDKDRSGQINFNEYASLHQFLNNLLQQFQAAERKTGTLGSISINDVAPALQSSGFSLSPTSIPNIAKRFDTQKRGTLTWEDFLSLVSHVALLRSVFEWSDTDKDGKITFDFEAFAYATLYL